MLSNSNQINESGSEVVKTLVIKIKEFSFYTGYLKKTGRDGLAYRVSIGGPQNLLVRRTNTSNRKGLPKRKELTVGKRGLQMPKEELASRRGSAHGWQKVKNQ